MTDTSKEAAERLADQLRGEGDAHFRGSVRDRRTIGAIMCSGGDTLRALLADRDKLEAENARLREAMTWRPIETAPKDGTRVVLARANWSEYPVAQWMEYPGNPVLDGDGNDCNMFGWGHDSIGFTVGHEDYWLGWSEDEMPTHWMPLPDATQETVRAADWIHRPTLLSDLKAMLQAKNIPEAETTNATIRAVKDMVRGLKLD